MCRVCRRKCRRDIILSPPPPPSDSVNPEQKKGVKIREVALSAAAIFFPPSPTSSQGGDLQLELRLGGRRMIKHLQGGAKILSRVRPSITHLRKKPKSVLFKKSEKKSYDSVALLRAKTSINYDGKPFDVTHHRLRRCNCRSSQDPSS